LFSNLTFTKTIFLTFLVFTLVFAFIACGSDDEVVETTSANEEKEVDEIKIIEKSTPYPEKDEAQSIAEIAVAGGFNTLVAALDAADLVETLSGDGTFTVFAPTDEAFAALPEGVLEGLLADTEALTQVLLYHVVGDVVKAETVVTLDAADTLQGSKVAIEVVDGNVFVNESQVTSTDIEASNGVIHVIDKVLVPELEESVDITESLKDYDVPGIKNITDLSWPRQVEAMNGLITIEDKPKRILTISTGHDEMIFGFANLNNIVGVTMFSQSPGGNIYELTKDMPTISSEIETIISQEPDIVFADPFANQNLMQSLVDIGITVVQTKLNNTSKGRINDILFTAYILDEIEEALVLIDAIEEQIDYINLIKNTIGDTEKTSILSVTYYDAYWAAGNGSTEGSIIELAGYTNIASKFGVESNNMITKESLIEMSPDVIVIPQSVEWGGQDFYDSLMSDESFNSIPAVINGDVHMVNTSHFTTLSHFNILGSIDLLNLVSEINIDGIEKPLLEACYQCFD